jgi:hypothetical protein
MFAKQRRHSSDLQQQYTTHHTQGAGKQATLELVNLHIISMS